jgi:small subunit ribosomal protein S16
VIAILSKTGDWQKFKGLPAPAEPLKVAAARADRTAAYEVEAKAAAGLVDETKARPAKKAAKAAKSEAPSPEAAAVDVKPDAAAEVNADVKAEESTDASTDAQG